MTNALYDSAINLLQQLIATPSFSKEESNTATAIEHWLQQHGVITYRYLNNVWAVNKFYNPALPTLLLNSHHDTVKPNAGYTIDPFKPIINDGKLYGLGSNDAGGCLVSLLACFVHFYPQGNLPFNLIIAATAEEEISGANGIEALLKETTFTQVTQWQNNTAIYGIVGEPTQMQMAVAERGLMVIDAVATGKAGHAARQEGVNALYIAVNDIAWCKAYAFERVSDFLGPVQTTVTSIHTPNTQHNVVPDTCSFVIDVRVNELYHFEEVLTTLQAKMQSVLTPRSTRLKSSMIALDTPLVQAGIQLGKQYYGSPTTSDKALIPFPALKIGPGDSARSHTANEYIYIHEIEQGINEYIALIQQCANYLSL
ncbi:MAG TPA: acetylornithine deacetylase [Chitinophagaceae bacterium]|nr:acetylornithine deacetylase [Chitinophagaceae bacterium]